MNDERIARVRWFAEQATRAGASIHPRLILDILDRRKM